MRAGRAGHARQAGMHGARGRGVQAAWALGRWAAQAQAHGALERAGARQQAGRACVGARTGLGALQGARTAGSGARGARGVRSRGGRRAAWCHTLTHGKPLLIIWSHEGLYREVGRF